VPVNPFQADALFVGVTRMGERRGGGRRTRTPFQELDHVLVSATSTTAPSRPSRGVNLTLPRFTSKKVSPKVVREVVSMAKREGAEVDVEQTVDLTTALALAIMSLPRSFLLWHPNQMFKKVHQSGIPCSRPLALIVDHGGILEHGCTSFIVLAASPTYGPSSRVMVDKGSDPYYNPTPLSDKEPRPDSSDKDGEQLDRAGQMPYTPQKPHPLDMHSQHHRAYQQQLGPMDGQMQPPNVSQHDPGMTSGFPGGSSYGI